MHERITFQLDTARTISLHAIETSSQQSTTTGLRKGRSTHH